jgi:SNF2 family DNA or RNA helicase
LGGRIVYGPEGKTWARIDHDRLSHLSGPLPRRRPQAERRARNRLQVRFGIEVGEFRELRGEEAAAMAEKLGSYSGRISGRKKLEAFGRALQPRMQREDDALNFDFVAGDAVVEPQRVLEAWRAGEEGVALAGGGWAALPSAFLEAQGERLADFLAARGSTGTLAAHSVGVVAPLCEAMETPLPPSFEALRPLAQDFAGIPASELPDDLTAQLRPYQRAGVDWLRFLAGAGLGAMLCDDMGLGKTLQALTAIETPALVVCPTSLLHNWRLEAERFRPGLKVRVHHGPRRELGVPGDDEVVVTSYGLLRMDLEELKGHRWRSLVLDEAQNIKNPDSKVARAAFELEADFRLTLSGTPVENRLDELWSQAHLTNPGLLGGRSEFKERFAQPIAAGDGQATARLREAIAPFLMRRLKREVAPELPPRTEVTVHCLLDEEERALYDALRSDVRSQGEDMLQGGKGVLSALEALLRLRQAACHRALVPGQEASDSAKLRRLKSDLEMAVASGHRALVFSQWTSFLDLVEPALRDIGVEFSRLDGSTKDRQALVDEFQSPQGPPVMLLSLMAGGTGLNLTAADHVYFLDPWWNPAVEAQAADRAHRIGQDRPVIIHRLVAEGTVDERILALQERKRALAEAVVAQGGGSITREDLLSLLD